VWIEAKSTEGMIDVEFWVFLVGGTQAESRAERECASWLWSCLRGLLRPPLGIDGTVLEPIVAFDTVVVCAV